jgi:type VI secretion system protein ImpB
MPESIQHKLDRVRPPRVQITYDVEIGDAIEKKELPFVVGILADLSGKRPDTLPALPPLKERKFVEIDRDNFNGVLKKVEPHLAFRVPNLIKKDGSEMAVALKFESIEDFEPLKVVNQVKDLNDLFEARQRLFDLLAKLDGNDDLAKLLTAAAADTEALKKIEADAKKAVEGADNGSNT